MEARHVSEESVSGTSSPGEETVFSIEHTKFLIELMRHVIDIR